MTPEKAWDTIVKRVSNHSEEFHTVPKNRRTPVWFLASGDGKYIYISEAKMNRPSSKISAVRKLTWSDFEKIYPLYFRREQGEVISAEATAITRNQVYYYSVIKHIVG